MVSTDPNGRGPCRFAVVLDNSDIVVVTPLPIEGAVFPLERDGRLSVAGDRFGDTAVFDNPQMVDTAGPAAEHFKPGPLSSVEPGQNRAHHLPVYLEPQPDGSPGSCVTGPVVQGVEHRFSGQFRGEDRR